MPENEKPLLLLIPGLDGTGKLFYRFVEPLSERFRVHPWCTRSGTGFGYPDLVSDLAEATRDEPEGSVRIVGESFGGTVCLHFALAFQERIHSMTLINTFSYYPRRWRIRLGIFFSRVFNRKEARLIKSFAEDRILKREGISIEDRDRFDRIIAEVDLPAYRRRLELVAQVDLRSRLGKIRVPTVLLASGRDKLVPSIAQARYMAGRMPRAEVHVFPYAGHALLLTPGFRLPDYIH